MPPRPDRPNAMDEAAQRLAAEMPAAAGPGSADDGRIELAQSVVADIAIRLRRLGLRLSHDDLVALVLELAHEQLVDGAADVDARPGS
jgi:hypothetical protein